MAAPPVSISLGRSFFFVFAFMNLIFRGRHQLGDFYLFACEASACGTDSSGSGGGGSGGESSSSAAGLAIARVRRRIARSAEEPYI